LKNILKYLAFTRSEIKVVLLLIFIICAGAGIKYFKSFSGKDNSQSKNYFEETDKRFISAVNYNPDNRNDLSFEEKKRLMESSDDSLKKSIDSTKSKKTKKEVLLEGKTININTAPKTELIKLPGVGAKTADKIIEYREIHGKFDSIEEIMEVKGIGPKKFEKMKKFLSIE
jgi:comEA protein